MSFRLAIIGRPNVGKSTLFNRLVGRRLALVDDLPGVTRDRREGEARLGDLAFTAVDTAGLEEAGPASLSGRMLAQTRLAIEQADAILFLIDARAGLTPGDHAFADLVRRSGKPAILIANKSEGASGAAGALEAYALGLGEERLLAGPEPGITRDAIASDLSWRGRQFRIYDTAGLRRRSKIDEKLEKLSAADALRAIRFADVVILLLEAGRAFEEQDLRIADLIEREGRAVVLAVNKWDLAERRAGAVAKLREEAAHRLPQIKGAPILPVSALLGEGIEPLMQAVLESYGVWNRRIATNLLNRWLEAAQASHPPPAVSGRRIKFNYMTQPKARPPTFVLFCSRADAVPDAYRRYLANGLREAFDLPGTPIRLTLREKRRR